MRGLAIAVFCVTNASIWAQSHPAGRSRDTNKQMDRVEDNILSDPALQANPTAALWLTAESQRGTLIWQTPFAQVDNDDGLHLLPVGLVKPPDVGEEGFGALPVGFWYDREKEGLYAFIGGYSLSDALDHLEDSFDADVDQLIATQPLLLEVLREYGTTPGGGGWVEAGDEYLDGRAAASATGFLAPEDPGDPPPDNRGPTPIPLPPDPLERCWAWLGLVGCNDGNQCTLDRCVSDGTEMGGFCTHTPLSGAPCDDGDPCTVGDQCVWRSCLGGAEFDCDDGDPCTNDVCGCPEGAPDCTPTCYNVPMICEDDEDPCTYGACEAGVCVFLPGSGSPCADDGDPCTDDVCNGGACTHPPVSGPCADDGNPCTDDVCNGGVCTHPPTGGLCADDGNPCTYDFCANGACSHPPSIGSCADDGNPCTDDWCSNGTCTHPATAGPCADDGNQCTDDRCSGGTCAHPPNSDPCDDGNPCTENDACSGGTCVGAVINCDDGSPCTDDMCLYGICSRLPNGNPGCEDGPCAGGCDDGNPCTVDSCENGTCTQTPHSEPCDDDDACTENDTCSAGACVGTAVDCTEHPGVDACSTNIHCEPEVGCIWDWPCDDGNPCTHDLCRDAVCAHNLQSGNACPDDGNPCTEDICDFGVCTHPPIDCDSAAGECEGPGTPNTGETEIFDQVQSSMVICLSAQGSIPVRHRIVTHNTGRSRDLYGMLRLSRVTGDPTVVDILYRGEAYALGSPIPVIESGHGGCGDHTWHDGVATFRLTPRKIGEVTLKAQVDPDPECCEGNGVPTVEAQVTVTVEGEVTTLTLDPSYIPAKTPWPTMPNYSRSEITVEWDPPECEGRLEIVEIDNQGNGYLPPNNGTLTPINASLWRYDAFDEPTDELCAKPVRVWIGAMQGDEELERVSILVYPVHRWWTLPAHIHGPGEQQHVRDNADLTNDYNFIRFKYAAVLATTQGGFFSMNISPNLCVGCPFGCVYACTTLGLDERYSVEFGTSTFTASENRAASIIGHELLHTTGADECAAYTWEFNHDTATGIFQCDTQYLGNMVQQLNCKCNGIGCP